MTTTPCYATANGTYKPLRSLARITDTVYRQASLKELLSRMHDIDIIDGVQTGMVAIGIPAEDLAIWVQVANAKNPQRYSWSPFISLWRTHPDLDEAYQQAYLNCVPGAWIDIASFSRPGDPLLSYIDEVLTSAGLTASSALARQDNNPVLTSLIELAGSAQSPQPA
jgi:hypothetical protein